MVSALKKFDKKMKLGKEYKISARGQRGGKRKPDFIATLLKKMDRFYIFKHRNGYKECILKVDFVTGDYRIGEV